MSATPTTTFTDEAMDEAWTPDAFGWRLDDGTEVLRVGRRLLVRVPDGRILEWCNIPTNVPLDRLVGRLRAEDGGDKPEQRILW